MSVDVGIGRALYEIENTNLAAGKTYKVYHDNDAVKNVLITAADATNPRIDIIVMKCDVSQDPDSAAANIASIIAIAGTPAGSPSAPATPANCLKIGQVAVAAGATSIVTANITDSRTYVTLDPDVLADIVRQSDLDAAVAVLASTDTGEGASTIGIEDPNGVFGSDNVEDALYELKVNPGADPRFGTGADGALNVTSGTTTIDLGGANVFEKNYTSINVSAGATLAFSNPASDGTIIIFRSQGNVTFAGTVDGRNLGATGAASNGSTTTANNGNAGTNAYNSFGQTRNGGAGQGNQNSSNARATGGGGAASTSTNGAASTAASPAAAADGGTALTFAVAGVGISGLIMAPGGGGGSGGAAASTTAGSTASATGGEGGRGAGALLVLCGGNYSDAGGTINFSGTAGLTGTKVDGTTQFSNAAGGGGGGGGGSYCALVNGTITMSGTRTVTGGANGASVGTGAGGNNGSAGAAGAGGNGVALVLPFI